MRRVGGGESLGRSFVAPYEHQLGAVPWLTAGTLTWRAADAADVLPAWRAWTERLPASALTAVRLTDRIVAVDVALSGDPWSAPSRLAPLRALRPDTDTVGPAAPAAVYGRRGGAPAPVAAATAPLTELPDLGALLPVCVPDGIALGARHDIAAGPALIAVGIVSELERLHVALAALDRALRAAID